VVKFFPITWTQWLAGTGRNWRPAPSDNPASASAYRVFISYRHVEPDRKWAKWLHSALETYRVPQAIADERCLGRRIGQVFRDEEELAASPDLNKEIRQALDRSDYLIVVCSPRTPHSKWVNAEVDHFRTIGREDRILALLIEGEPAEAFPTSLCAIRGSLTNRNDLPSNQIETVEPLAADVRPAQGESLWRRRRRALIRLLAPILGCRFDDLQQREQERQTRLLKNWALAATAIIGLLIGLTVYAEISRQEAVRQRDHALEAQSYLLSELSKQQTATGGARVGILLALEALPTNISAPNRPYVATAESALYQALVVPREIGVLRGHTDAVRRVAFSPDGLRIITASSDHTARIWDTTSFRPPIVLTGHGDGVMHVVYSPDGTHIVTASADGTARVWLASDGNERSVLRGHADKVIHAVFNHDGTRVATASHDGTARIWDVTSGKELVVLRGHTGKLSSVDFSPNGSRVVTASEDGTARLWSATSGKNLIVLRGHGKKVNWAAYSPGGRHVVTSSDDGTARIWTASNGRSMVLQGHTKSVLHAVFSPDGTRVATASEDGTARLWRASDGTEIAMLNPGESIVNHAEFSPDGNHLVTSSGVLDLANSTARLWDATTGVQEAILHGHEGMLFHAVFSPAGDRIATASYDNTARLWTTNGSLKVPNMTEDCRINTDSTASLIKGTTGDPHSSSKARVFNSYAEAGAKAMKFRQFLETLNFVDELHAEDGRITRVIGMPERSLPILVNLESHTITELRGHNQVVHSAAFSLDGRLIVTASSDHTARLWNGVNGAPIAILNGHTDTVWNAAINSDGTRAVTASEDHTARLWTVDGTPLLILKGHDAGVIHVSFSPRGNMIATASWDGTARIWDASTGTTLHILRGHRDKVLNAGFSPEGRRVATASSDGTARLWDVSSGQEIAVLPGPDRFVLDATFNEEGDRITISGSVDSQRCFRIFRNTQALVEFAQSLPVEKLSQKERNRYRLEQPER
jgi:WD40 repeat protein